jgi:tight adherence protein B
MTSSWAAVLAVVAAGGAGAALPAGGEATGRVHRLALASGGRGGSPTWRNAMGSVARRRRPGRPRALRLGMLLAGLVAIGVLDATVMSVLAVPVGLAVMRIRRNRIRRRAAVARRVEVIELCQALCAELLAGSTPRDALARAGRAIETPSALELASLASIDDLPAALRAAAKQPGAEALASVAACWQVAEHQGGGLAPALRRLTDSLRAEEALRREIASQLAGARATARLLAGLPALGLLLGSGLGGRPVDILLHTPQGVACLVAGVSLQVAGVWWVDRIAAAAERRA